MGNGSSGVRAGDPRDEAIPALIDAHGNRIFALAVRICGKVEEAEDLLQEIFLQAYRKWEQFDGRSSPISWLYTIATRACQRMHRPRAGQPKHIQSLDVSSPFEAPRIASVPGPDASVLDEHIRREAVERIEGAISDLPGEYRIPLILKDIAGLSVAEVGDVLGLNGNTVKTRVHRARLKVREAMESALPQREVPPAAYDRRVCMDLLLAKQEAIDRGVAFPLGEEFVCERCRAVFAGLDLAFDVCGALGRGHLPPPVRERLLKHLEAA